MSAREEQDQSQVGQGQSEDLLSQLDAIPDPNATPGNSSVGAGPLPGPEASTGGASDFREGQRPEAAQPFGAQNPTPTPSHVHHDPNDYDFDDEELQETFGMAWTQNVRLIVAIVVVIISAIFLWWFLW